MSKSRMSSNAGIKTENNVGPFLNSSIFEPLSPKNNFMSRNGMAKSKSPFFRTQKAFNSHKPEDYQ